MAASEQTAKDNSSLPAGMASYGRARAATSRDSPLQSSLPNTKGKKSGKGKGGASEGYGIDKDFGVVELEVDKSFVDAMDDTKFDGVLQGPRRKAPSDVPSGSSTPGNQRRSQPPRRL